MVVSDTSPARALHHLGLLDVLQRIYGTVIAPPAVWGELFAPRGRFPVLDLRTLPYFTIRPPAGGAAVSRALGLLDPGLAASLDAGETEVIALALELRADLVLVDEASGRLAARRLGLVVTGTLGVLLKAKGAGRIARVRPLIDELKGGLGFFVAPALYAEVCRLAGE